MTSHSWEYQLVDGRDLSTGRGWLKRVTGGKISETYRGENRASCSLDLDGEEIPLGCAVRIWHATEESRECLGTFIPEPMDSTYQYGRKSGTVELYSTIKRLSTMFSSAITGVGKVNVLSHFREVVTNAYSTPWVQPSWQTSKLFSKAYTWNRTQESNLAEAQRCADAVNGYIGVDAQGRVTMRPYVQPWKLPQSWTLADVTLDGVEIDVPEIVNRVVAYYERSSGNTTKTYAQMAELPTTSPYYKGRIYRHETVTINPPTIDESGNINAQLLAYAQKELAAQQSKNVYSCSALYDSRVKCGTAGKLNYTDSPSGTLSANVFCSAREIALDHTAMMTLTLEEV